MSGFRGFGALGFGLRRGTPEALNPKLPRILKPKGASGFGALRFCDLGLFPKGSMYPNHLFFGLEVNRVGQYP